MTQLVSQPCCAPVLAPKLCDAFLSFFLPPLLGVSAKLAQELVSHNLSFDASHTRKVLILFERLHDNTLFFTPTKKGTNTKEGVLRMAQVYYRGTAVKAKTTTVNGICDSVAES